MCIRSDGQSMGGSVCPNSSSYSEDPWSHHSCYADCEGRDDLSQLLWPRISFADWYKANSIYDLSILILRSYAARPHWAWAVILLSLLGSNIHSVHKVQWWLFSISLSLSSDVLTVRATHSSGCCDCRKELRGVSEVENHIRFHPNGISLEEECVYLTTPLRQQPALTPLPQPTPMSPPWLQLPAQQRNLTNHTSRRHVD